MLKPIEQTNIKSLLNEYGTSSTISLLCAILFLVTLIHCN